MLRICPNSLKYVISSFLLVIAEDLYVSCCWCSRNHWNKEGEEERTLHIVYCFVPFLNHDLDGCYNGTLSSGFVLFEVVPICGALSVKPCNQLRFIAPHACFMKLKRRSNAFLLLEDGCSKFQIKIRGAKPTTCQFLLRIGYADLFV